MKYLTGNIILCILLWSCEAKSLRERRSNDLGKEQEKNCLTNCQSTNGRNFINCNQIICPTLIECCRKAMPAGIFLEEKIAPDECCKATKENAADFFIEHKAKLQKFPAERAEVELEHVNKRIKVVR